jgi:hypothetical protein
MQSHPGFKAVASKIAAQQNVPMKQADAILAAKSRHASPEAKRRNPRLNRVADRQKAIAQRLKQAGGS